MSFMAAAAFVGVGLSAVSMQGAAATGRAQARGSAAMLRADRATRAANQQVENEDARLAQHLRNLSNSRVLAAGAKTYEAAQRNAIRSQDSRTSADFESQIQDAEAAGAYAANVSSKGVVGASSAMIELTMQLRNSRAAEIRDRQGGQADYDSLQQIAGIVPQAVASMDMGVNSMGTDLSVTAPQIVRGTDYAGSLANLVPMIGQGIQAWNAKGASTPGPSTMKPTTYGLQAPTNWGMSSIKLM